MKATTLATKDVGAVHKATRLDHYQHLWQISPREWPPRTEHCPLIKHIFMRGDLNAAKIGRLEVSWAHWGSQEVFVHSCIVGNY